MNELQKLAIFLFIASILCIIMCVGMLIKKDYGGFVFFMIMSIIGIIVSIYAYRKNKVIEK